MAWKSASSLGTSQHTRRGLQASLVAGQLCIHAEKLYPDLFHAISVRNEVMHLETPAQQVMKFKLIEGKLLKELQAYAQGKNLPVVTRIRLTIAPS